MFRVLSLFDGISCAQVAINRLGVKDYEYYAAEVDKYAIQVTQKNYPNTIQLGDVTKVKGEDLPKIDLLVGGSPCQGFSYAGKQLNFEDERSKLFFEFVRILKEVKPKYFLLENVRMKKEYQKVISDYLGVEPVEINSSLLSAQNRQRLYWSNLEIKQPKDKGIILKDIIEEGIVDRTKSYCLDASYFKGGNPKQYFTKSRRQLVFNYSSSGRGNGIIEGRFNYSDKALTLTASGYSNRAITGVIIEGMKWRKLTPIECERLQTLPDNYTEGVSNTQRYKALGNGFTVDVIAHILKGIL